MSRELFGLGKTDDVLVDLPERFLRVVNNTGLFDEIVHG